MRLLASSLLLLPALAFAADPAASSVETSAVSHIEPPVVSHEPFASRKDITFRASAKAQLVRVRLDRDVLENRGRDLRVQRDDGVAVPYFPLEESADALPKAAIDVSPTPADTVPRTQVNFLRDGDYTTIFQPLTGKTHVFRFRFAQPIAASAWIFEKDGSMDVEEITVRIGNEGSSLREVYRGGLYDSRVDLPAEFARVYEVRIVMRTGVLRLTEMKLLDKRETVSFRADPGRKYALLYGASLPVPGPGPDLLWDSLPKTDGTLGAARAAKGTGDGDGIPPEKDNCPAVWNDEQQDRDGDGQGDACDLCPDDADPGSSGPGKACADDDKDGINNARDNCPAQHNPEQSDQDQDGKGNVCDTTDNRFSANRPWLLWACMGAIIAAILGVGAMVLRHAPKDE